MHLIKKYNFIDSLFFNFLEPVFFYEKFNYVNNFSITSYYPNKIENMLFSKYNYYILIFSNNDYFVVTVYNKNIYFYKILSQYNFILHYNINDLNVNDIWCEKVEDKYIYVCYSYEFNSLIYINFIIIDIYEKIIKFNANLLKNGINPTMSVSSGKNYLIFLYYNNNKVYF